MNDNVIRFLCLVYVMMTTRAQPRCQSRYSEYGYMLTSSSYKTYTTPDLRTCFIECISDHLQCCSINYSAGTCSRNYVTKQEFSERFIKHDNTIYAAVRDPELGSSKNTPVLSCKRLREINREASSGTYWISPKDSTSRVSPFQVFCDMSTDGGGWTLVYNYRFTKFASRFVAKSNAVTPIPTWPFKIPARVVPQSKTAPLNESFYSALDYALWKVVGSQFLYKSTITHWASCSPGTGDLLRWKPGSLNCKNVKNVAPKCLNKAPNAFSLSFPCGPALSTNGGMSVYFEGYLAKCFPLHDPCGARRTRNHVTNAGKPGGSIYVR